VATISGHVRAGGIGIMAACDVVFVARHTDFAFTETKLGAIPALISGPLFNRVAPHLISRYYLSGEVFDAETAYNMGLVTEAVDDPTAAANDWATNVAAAAPGAVSATLELLRQAVAGGLPTLRALQELSERTFAGAEAQEGIRALLEKRKPVWGAFEAP
jgi:enoyl-CoA hydratase/carnithine racemase